MQWFRTFLLMAVMTLLLMVLGSVIGGRNGAITALAIAGVMNMVAYWFSDKMVLHRYKAQEVGPEDTTGLYSIVKEISTLGRVPMPRVYVIPTDAPNAFATGRSPKHAAVAATQGIIRTLDRRELKGVMAHELAHVQNRDILTQSIAATLAGAIGYLAFGARLRAIFGDRREGGGGSALVLLLALLAPLAAMLVQMAISRTREFGADEGGARLTKDPEALAQALVKISNGVARHPMGDEAATTAHLFIVNPLHAGGVAKLFSTHPPLEERVSRLRALVGRV
jgi:heat shock protein HtpX